MISVEDLEEKIFLYMTKNGHAPKYVLLDKKSHDEFSQQFYPKEKVRPYPQEDMSVVSWQSSHSTNSIGILSVDTHKTIFEAVS